MQSETETGARVGRRTFWSLLISGIGFGVGVTLAVIAAVLIWNVYQSRPVPWNLRALTASGVPIESVLTKSPGTLSSAKAQEEYVRKTLYDPLFQQLPMEVRLKTLSVLAPDFAGLPRQEQIKVFDQTAIVALNGQIVFDVQNNTDGDITVPKNVVVMKRDGKTKALETVEEASLNQDYFIPARQKVKITMPVPCKGPLQLSEDRRAQLDGIVQKMDSAGAKTKEIQAVVDDFKAKYGNACFGVSYEQSEAIVLFDHVNHLQIDVPILSPAAPTKDPLGIFSDKPALRDCLNQINPKDPLGLITKDENQDKKRKACVDTYSR